MALVVRSSGGALQPTPSRLDIAEARILASPNTEYRPYGGDFQCAPLTHRFTPGLYIREIFMPAGHVFTTYVHAVEHPYVVSKGHCSVYLEAEDRWLEVRAPHTGITKPGTRRLLLTHEDTIWTTFHPTDLTDVEEIERAITIPYENPLLEGGRVRPEALALVMPQRGGAGVLTTGENHDAWA